MGHMIERRAFVAVSAASALTLAACGNAASPGKDTSVSYETSGNDGPKVLRFGMASLGAPLDMQKNGMSVAGTLTDNIFEGLLGWTSEGELVAVLLSEVPTFEPDGVTINCELLEGVTFHDGSLLTADDVKFTFERMFNPATGASNYSNYTQIKGASAMLAGEADNLDEGIIITDDTHFSFVLEEPSAVFIPSLGINYAHIFPREACSAAGEDWGVGTNAVGTGKFTLVANDDATEAIFVRYDSYHGEAAALDEIRIEYYADTTTKLLAFKNGDIDWCDVSFSLYGEYSDDPDFADAMLPYRPLGLQFINLNLSDEQLVDERVRQALSLAIDRQELIDTILAGQGQAASGFLTPEIPGFDERAPAFAYDPDRAQALLAEAAPEGLTIDFRTRTLFKAVAEAVQGYWSAVGIDVSLTEMETGTFMQEWSDGSLQVLVNGWFADYPSADGMFATYFTSDRSATRSSFYSNPEFDQLVADARVELDADAQADLYRQADDILTRQDYATIPLVYPHYNCAVKPYVLGATVTNMAFNLRDADIDTSDPDYTSA